MTGSLNISEIAQIRSYSKDNGGDAGAITVNAGQMRIDGSKEIDSDGFNSAGILSKTFTKGKAGSVTVNLIDSLDLLRLGQISSTASGGDGDAGDVTVSAKQLLIEGPEQAINDIRENAIRTGIVTSSFLDTNLGKAGNIDVKVTDSLIVRSSIAAIEADSFSQGRAGNVTVHAGQLDIKDTAYISSDVLNRGSGGEITVKVKDSLNILNGGTIGSRPLSVDGITKTGNAGVVKVEAGQMQINGGSVSTSTSSGGNAGTVDVMVVDSLKIEGSGSIKSETLGRGTAGDITVKAGQIRINGPGSIISTRANVGSSGKTGSINILFTDLLLLDNSSTISTTTTSGDGGAIAIAKTREEKDESGAITKAAESGDIIYLRNSQITTSVTADPGGSGGSIDIFARNLVLNGGFIQANTKASGASGGEVNVNVLALVPSSNALFLNGKEILESDRSPGLNVIQAVAENGASAPVQAPPPQLNLSGILANLTIPSFDSNALNRNMCTVEEGSTMLQSGKGGLPMRARDFLLIPTY